MAAEEVRVKLQFDYPPPAVPESRQLWLLLNTEQCRAVTDLSCLIGERFYPQRRGALSLYLQNCLLPPGESVRLLRDNDLIRVKWEAYDPSEEADEPDSQSQPRKKSKKRRRSSSEEDSEDRSAITSKKAICLPDQTPQKKKKRSQEARDPGDTSERKAMKKKKKKHKIEEDPLPPSPPAKKDKANPSQDPSLSDKKTHSAARRPKKPKERDPDRAPIGAANTSRKSSTSEKTKESSTSSSEEEPSIIRKKATNSGAPTSAAKTPGSSSRAGKRKESSSSSSSSEEEPPTASVKPVKSGASTTTANTPGSSSRVEKRKESSWSSSEEPPTASRKSTNSGAPTSDAKTSGSSGRAGKREDSSTSSSSSSSDEESPSPSMKTINSGVPGRSPGKAESASSSSPKDGATQSRPVALVTASPLNGTNKKATHENSSSDSDTFVIKKSLMAPSSIHNGHLSSGDGVQQGPAPNPGVFGRGRGRGGEYPPWRGKQGRGFSRGRGVSRGRGQQFFYSYDSEVLKEQQLQEPTSNISIIVQNPPELPRKDYSTLPLLAAPPQVGKVIAFKLLELTESYTPEVSEYKEGRILSYNPVTQQLEVEVLSRQKRKEPGKFDLVYQTEEGRNVIEYAVPQDHKITQHWSSLIEPRLVMENESESRST